MWRFIKDDCDPVSGAKMLDKADYEPIPSDSDKLRFRRVSKEEWQFTFSTERWVKRRMAQLSLEKNSRAVSAFIFCTDMFTKERA